MRRDRNTGKLYHGFGDWLRDGHMLWIIMLFFAYGWYLGATEDV